MTTTNNRGAALWALQGAGWLLLTYIPLLGVGLVGHLRGRNWGLMALAAALGITVYWPVVSLAALVAARDASGWRVASETPYWIVCLLIAGWGVWALLWVIRGKRQPVQAKAGA